MMNVILIPLDNRPVSYTLPKQIAMLNNDINLLLPPREMTGSLTKDADIQEIICWIKQILQTNKVDSIICSLDTIAYGGLIPSRRSPVDENTIISRLNKFKNVVENSQQKPRIYAFSSIMRISNNNINEEEKQYWDKYGKLIFKYSFLTDKAECCNDVSPDEIKEIQNQIPEDILQDYFMTRQRNLNINFFYLNWLKSGFLDFLVFSQDDTAKYGINVKEGRILASEIKNNSLSDKACIKTGADEIPTDLLTRSLVEHFNVNISIYPVYTTPNGKDIISRYEDVTIEQSTKGQIELCGASYVDNTDKADIILIVHTPENQQNDHAMKLYPEKENEKAIISGLNYYENSDRPVMIADIACANGGDNKFVQQLLLKGIDTNKLYGYAGWNTTGNTLGSLISAGISRLIAEKNKTFNADNYKTLLLTRLGDDWVYQTIVRQKIRAFTENADEQLLEEEMTPYIKNLKAKLDINSGKISYKFPWERTFEVEIVIE